MKTSEKLKGELLSARMMTIIPFGLIGLSLMMMYVSIYELPNWPITIIAGGMVIGSVWAAICTLKENALLKKTILLWQRLEDGARDFSAGEKNTYALYEEKRVKLENIEKDRARLTEEIKSCKEFLERNTK